MGRESWREEKTLIMLGTAFKRGSNLAGAHGVEQGKRQGQCIGIIYHFSFVETACPLRQRNKLYFDSIIPLISVSNKHQQAIITMYTCEQQFMNIFSTLYF
jgi:hypothetical protein